MIVINGRFLTQKTTGVQRYAHEVTRQLLDQRHDVLVVAPDRELHLNGLPEARVTKVGSRSGHAWEQWDLPRFLKAAGRPILLSLTSTAPIAYRPQVSTHHDVTYVHHPESYSASFRLLYRALIPRVIASSSGLITVSEFSRREIATHLRIDPARFTVAHNAADERFQPSADRDVPRGADDAPYFLAVSSPNAHKNFGRLIEAFTQLRREEPLARLLIIGEQSRSFARQDHTTATSDGVEFLGRLSDDDLIGYYQHACAFVFPSLYEGFGIPPIEAQQCGCPVIASHSASMPEVLADSAFFVNPLSVADISRTMLRVLRSPGERNEMIRRGFANARRFSWASTAVTVSNLLDEISTSRSQD